MPRRASIRSCSIRCFTSVKRRYFERRELETSRDAIKAGLDSGPGVLADEVFAELRARFADKSWSVAKLVILPAARADLIDFITLGNPPRALSFVAEIEAKIAENRRAPRQLPETG